MNKVPKNPKWKKPLKQGADKKKKRMEVTNNEAQLPKKLTQELQNCTDALRNFMESAKNVADGQKNVAEKAKNRAQKAKNKADAPGKPSGMHPCVNLRY